jgi:hypothetical protein
MNETLSKYLAIGLLLGLMAGFLAYVFTNQVFFIEAGSAVGIIAGAAVGSLLSKNNK